VKKLNLISSKKCFVYLQKFLIVEMKIGILREGKVPHDNRVALSPHQCKVIKRKYPQIQIVIQPSIIRCYADFEYEEVGIKLQENLSDCDILLGIKEVPIENLIAEKTYLFFSHTRKKQPHNKKLLQSILKNKIRLIDYECLTYSDGQRVLGFGFFAGIVGAHNGLMAYGKKTSTFHLPPMYKFKDFREVVHQYFEVKLPNIKIISTGNGRVSTGVQETMNMFDIKRVGKNDFLKKIFEYPVYCELTAEDLYKHNDTHVYHRSDFRKNPTNYYCDFEKYYQVADVMLNGVYWQKGIAPFFKMDDIKINNFHIKTIADITCDVNGSIPCNVGATTIADPTYGIDKTTLQKTLPYLPNTIDVMAVDNLPNELPRDASDFFGVQFTKNVLPELLKNESDLLKRATIADSGALTSHFQYLSDYIE
jgi:saccharopine dehydrogenase (NAD+, L-lysine forming)